MFKVWWTTYLWRILKIRRILSQVIKYRVPTIFVLVCICSPLTLLVIKKSFKIVKQIPIRNGGSLDSKWQDVAVPGQIRSLRIKNNNHDSFQNYSKNILLWTTYFSEEFSDDFYFFQEGYRTFQSYKCEFSNCFVTSNRSTLPTADAVLFHAKDMNFSDIPQRGKEDQIWILYSMEPPHYMLLKWQLIRSLFNWTMTYRSDSDVQVKYGEIKRREESRDRETRRHKSVEERSKGAVWLVSNCRTQSRREAYVKELKKTFDVDIYGKCSRKRKCDPAQSEKCYKLVEDYKYYLSFENSLCKDYITEKFYNILRYDVVPVVLGGGDYSSVAPLNSFIDASRFPDPEELGKHLTAVASNSSWYDSFFEWKGRYGVHLHPWMCDLCKLLNKPRFETRILPKNLWSWWVPGALCKRWSKKKGFKNVF